MRQKISDGGRHVDPGPASHRHVALVTILAIGTTYRNDVLDSGKKCVASV